MWARPKPRTDAVVLYSAQCMRTTSAARSRQWYARGEPRITVQPMSQRKHGWRRSSGVFRGEVTRALAVRTKPVVAPRRAQWLSVAGTKWETGPSNGDGSVRVCWEHAQSGGQVMVWSNAVVVQSWGPCNRGGIPQGRGSMFEG